MTATSQFSEERTTRIVEALRLGATRNAAASCAGIAPSTLYDWIRRGKAGESPYTNLWERIEIEQRAWEVEALKRIHDAAAKGTWQAAAWLLERRLPKYYGRRMDDSAVNSAAERLVRKSEKEAGRMSPAEVITRLAEDPAIVAAVKARLALMEAKPGKRIA